MSRRTILWVGCLGLAAIGVWSPWDTRAGGARTSPIADRTELSMQIEHFYSLLESGDVEQAEDLGNRLVADPGKVSQLFDPIADGSVDPDRLAHWVGVIDICTASYIKAPNESETTESERAEFLRKALEAVYALPPDLARDLLARRAQYGGFGPGDATALAELLGLPGCFDSALISLHALQEDGVLVLSERNARLLREAAQRMSIERDHVRCSDVLGLLLSRGVAADLRLLEGVLLETQDAHSRGVLLRSALKYPDAEIGWACLAAIAEGVEGPFDGFSVSRLPVEIPADWRALARDLCLGATPPRSRLLLVDILRDDPEMLGLLVESDTDPLVVSKAIRLLGSSPPGLDRLVGSLIVRLCPVSGVDGDRVPIEVLHAALSTLEDAASKSWPDSESARLRAATNCLALHATSRFTQAADRGRMDALLRSTARTGDAPQGNVPPVSDSEVGR